MTALPALFSARLGESRLLQGAPAVLAAVSGGSDSTALLVLLAVWAASERVPLAAAHVAHGLRGAAGEADAEAVRELAAVLRVPFTLLRADVAALRRRGESLEAGARRARYAALAEAARALGPGALVATGHTRDDQAETTLLNLERRSGRARGGIRPRRGDGVVRPLLSFSRLELRAHLAALGIGWREDETNEDERLTRNRLRRRVMPRLEAEAPGASERLARAGEAWSARVDALDAELDAAFPECNASGPFPRAAVDRLRPELLGRLLVRAASRVCDRPPGRAQVVRAVARLGAGESFEEALAGRRLAADGRIVRLLPRK